MKNTITRQQLLDENNIMSYVILDGVNSEDNTKLANAFDEKGALDMVLTVDGIQIDAEKFFNQVYASFNNKVESKARELLSEMTTNKIASFIEKLNSMEEVVHEWESEINWDKPNPLT